MRRLHGPVQQRDAAVEDERERPHGGAAESGAPARARSGRAVTKRGGGRRKPRPGSGIHGPKVVYGYVAAGMLVLIILAFRAPGLKAWLIWSAAFLIPYLVSFRCAVIHAYRRNLKALNWWLQPAATEREFEGAWHVYAVAFAIGALAITLLH